MREGIVVRSFDRAVEKPPRALVPLFHRILARSKRMKVLFCQQPLLVICSKGFWETMFLHVDALTYNAAPKIVGKTCGDDDGRAV